jgi:hypothetical protein
MWACGDDGAYHEFRGVSVDIHEWSPEALSIQERIVSEFDVYNNFLFNQSLSRCFLLLHTLTENCIPKINPFSL